MQKIFVESYHHVHHNVCTSWYELSHLSETVKHAPLLVAVVSNITSVTSEHSSK